ncbi:unnamed protein product [Mesocestoides corti]|uniref:Neuropeptide n=1 Tax=Mesocestoides corti TaxID=53468 RepID=A0A0R3UG41_MESCO|nr:unnamed protein product [Mesocestoides corti]
MSSTKLIVCVSLFCYLALLEVPFANCGRLQRQLLDALTNADSLEDLESQLLLDELTSPSQEFRRRLASKRGFVRLG